jgi:hypothetical protein
MHIQGLRKAAAFRPLLRHACYWGFALKAYPKLIMLTGIIGR